MRQALFGVLKCSAICYRSEVVSVHAKSVLFGNRWEEWFGERGSWCFMSCLAVPCLHGLLW